MAAEARPGVIDFHKPKLVLFLGTDDRCRSRFAEILFNHRAAKHGIGWLAVSRGLCAEPLPRLGEVSRSVVLGLARRRIPTGEHRLPMRVLDCEIAAADRVIAMHEAEHRFLVELFHPRAAERVEYWDIGAAEPSALHDPLEAIETRVRDLILGLSVESVVGPLRAVVATDRPAPGPRASAIRGAPAPAEPVRSWPASPRPAIGHRPLPARVPSSV
jgi:protein-tyrosine phosphatase